MRISKWMLLAILLLAFYMHGYGQDSIPKPARIDRMSVIVPSSEAMQKLFQLLPVEDAMPDEFRNVKENVIEDTFGELSSFFSKLNQPDKIVRIVHIGDSHVRGHVFPYVMRLHLEEDFGKEAVVDKPLTYRTSGLAEETGNPGIVYHIMGVNGATCASYITPERMEAIAQLKPDLVICSFGTNEAHGLRYSSAEHRAAMLRMTGMLRAENPEVCLLFTTPPGAYVKRRRGKKQINRQTSKVVDTQLEFCKKYHLAVWDMYHIIGGETDACQNWTRAGVIRKDGIHFSHEGYTIQGNLLHQAFIKAYNSYVGDRLE